MRPRFAQHFRRWCLMVPRPWLDHYDEGVPATLEPYPELTLVDYLFGIGARSADASCGALQGWFDDRLTAGATQ